MFCSYIISIALFSSNSNSPGWVQGIICRFRVITRAVSLYVSLIFHWTTVPSIRNFGKCNMVYIELLAEEQIWNSCAECMSRKHGNQVKMLCKRSAQEAGQTETYFFFLSHSQQRTRAGASTLAPALTSFFSNRPGYFCNPLWFGVFFSSLDLQN